MITDVFKVTLGLLVSYGRDKAAEKLKDGDVTAEKIRGLIQREKNKIQSTLDESERTDLLTSISLFREGIEYLYEVLRKRTRSRSEYGALTTQAACAETFYLMEETKNLDPTGLDKSATRALLNAKNRFNASREYATRAFNNGALSTSHRIRAMQYRVMATILETVDHLADALAPCRVCIENLHGLTAVQNSFRVTLNEGMRARLNTLERLEIIFSVCHVNRVIYDVACMINRYSNKEDSKIMILEHCPSVSISDSKNNTVTEVYPLFDSRVADAINQLDVEHVCVPWSFGQEGEEQHQIMKPQLGFATNSHGNFVIADYGDGNVKMFDSNGNYQSAFCPTSDDGTPDLYVYDVATDLKDMIYVLAGKTQVLGHVEYGVHMFINTAEPYHKFSLQTEGDWNRVLVNDNRKVMVIGTAGGKEVVDVYESTGKRFRRFGEGVLKDVCDATAVKDGNVMVVDMFDSCIHLFSERGKHLKQFQLRGRYNHVSIAYHRASKVVVVSGVDRGRQEGSLQFFAYTKDGEFVSSLEVYRKEFMSHTKFAMYIDHLGRIALGFQDDKGKGKMLVV